MNYNFFSSEVFGWLRITPKATTMNFTTAILEKKKLSLRWCDFVATTSHNNYIKENKIRYHYPAKKTQNTLNTIHTTMSAWHVQTLFCDFDNKWTFFFISFTPHSSRNASIFITHIWVINHNRSIFMFLYVRHILRRSSSICTWCTHRWLFPIFFSSNGSTY